MTSSRAERARPVPAVAAASTIGVPRAHRAALALWIALAAVALARAVATFVPSMWAWGVNGMRFVSPGLAWPLWALTALALVPPLARRATPPLARLGDAFARGSVVASAALCVGVAALAWFLPDRVRFVGDFLLRLGATEQARPAASVFPQALPLDVWLHYRVPVVLLDGGAMAVGTTMRVLGAIEAALLAGLGVAFARALALRGSAACAASCVVVFGGALAMFTGYGKAVGEIVVLVAAVGVLGVRVARTGRGVVALGAAVALGLLLHRSALGLLPAAALALALGARRQERAPVAAWLAAVALPLAALAASGARIAHTLAHGDLPVHLASSEVRAGGGLLAAAVAGTRPADVLDLIALLSPLALPALVAALAWGSGPRAPSAASKAATVGNNRDTLAVLAILALPFVLVLLVIHPAQGPYRDWDDFAPTGIALSLLAAWGVGELLRAAPRFEWLGVAVACAAVVPSVQWLAHNADAARGLARVTAFVTEPPRRSAIERGTTWDFLGIRHQQLGDRDASADAMAHAAETIPSARVVLQWALAEEARGNLAGADSVYRRAVVLNPSSVLAWRGLMFVALRRGDSTTALGAAAELDRLHPGPRNVEHVRAVLAGEAPMPGDE